MIGILILLLFLITPFLLAEAFFSGSEISFLSANRPKLLRKAKEGVAGAVLAKDLLSKPESLFATTVVGTTLALSCTTTIATLFIIKKVGVGAEWINLCFLTPIILVFGEFVPKMIGRAHADRIVLAISRPISIASLALSPLTKTLGFYAKVLKVLLGDRKSTRLNSSH